jgi:copper chaperone CopZ
MYGDHHVVAVRNLLFAIPGVEDVYASSSFRVAEIQFDENLVDEEDIRSALEAAGYLEELPVAVEAGALPEMNGKASFRHTASFGQTGVVAFAQEMPAVGRPLWPCPGLKRVDRTEEVATDGQEG